MDRQKFQISKTEVRSIKILKTIQLPHSIYLTTHYQTLDEVTWLLRQEKLNKRQKLKKFENGKFYLKTSISRIVKLLKTNPLKLKTMQ